SGGAQQTAGQSSNQAPAPAATVAGEYKDVADPDNLLTFYVQNGVLMMESDRSVPEKMKAFSATEFGMETEKYRFRFAGSGAQATLTILDEKGEAAQSFQRVGEPVRRVFHDYERSEAMIPMRDGVKLHVVYLKPKDITTPLPFLIQRTPYGCEGTSRGSFFGGRPELAREGFIYVCADIRGRYKSEGEFVMNRSMVADHKDPKSIDESTDAYDTVEWLLKNVPGNNGRAGFIGTSYPGFTAMAAGIDPHPAVKAISPQAPMIDAWIGDDFFHNGAFRQTYGYDYGLGMESSKENTEVSYGKDANGKPRDGFDFFLERGSFAEDVKQSGSPMLPTWQRFIEHPSYDQVWRSHGVQHWLTKVTVPTLTVGGYYDQEDMWGSQEEYASLEPHDDMHENFLVLGPWRHGSWSSTTRHLGNIEYGEPIGQEFRRQIEVKFFAHYLKDAPGENKAGFDLQDTASFQTGSNTWKRYSHFPPEEAQVTALHLEGDGKLAWSDPKTKTQMSYVSDPANPVPYRHRPIQPTYSDGSQWFNWLTEDQRFVTDRKDVAVWKLPVLKKDMVVTGEVLADIFASTTGTDGDFVVKLIDQYPDNDQDPKMRGYQLMTNMEIYRGRYLDGFDKPRAIKADAVREYKFSLHDVDHVFKAGHTVVVEVQSTWFPLYDRNPQTFVPNIMTAKPADYKPATITVYSDVEHDSNLQIPLMNQCDVIDCF
ncbi:MAG TPA: CocE/NonD family hydrolase, partial [Terracidiphilus sp.]